MAGVSLSERSLRMLADSGSYERGRVYYDSGWVRKYTAQGDTVSAVVQGSRLYRVKLTLAPVRVTGECDCPMGADGVFCKHCVAVALAWLATKQEPAPERTLEEFLLAQKPSWLVAELLEAAAADPVLRARLDAVAGVQVAFSSGDFRKRLEAAIKIDGSVDYRAARAYFRGVDEVLDELAELVDQGLGEEARGLAEYALDLLAESGLRVDDSDGGLSEAFATVEEIHYNACLASVPDPLELAEYLVDRALNGGYDLFAGALENYALVLGPSGTARYRELVEQAWQDLPPRTSTAYDGRRQTVMFLLEHLAGGDVDAWIAVLARDLTQGLDVIRIARRLVEERRDEEALEWLQRGLTEFPPDWRLRTLAAECHVRAGRHQEAAALLWDNFTERPVRETYTALEDAAGDLFPTWRRKAHAHLRKLPRLATRFSPQRPANGGHSTLVEILLAEADIDGAWRAAKAGGCVDGTWLRLARRRAHTHPADAVPIFLAAADHAILMMQSRDNYQRAAQLLVEAQPLAKESGRAEEFEAHLAAFRAAHKRKRALLDELNRARLP